MIPHASGGVLKIVILRELVASRVEFCDTPRAELDDEELNYYKK